MTRKRTHDEFVELLNRTKDGEQHYRAIDFFGGDEAFNTQVIHDRMKRDFATEKGITLLEIPYSVTGQDIHDFLYKSILRKAEGLTPKRETEI